MEKNKEVQITASFNRCKKIDLHESKILCAGCRKEMEVWGLYYDDVSTELLCRICRCAYATIGQQQIEMEDK